MESNITISKLVDVADVVDSLHKTPKYSSLGYPMIRCVDLGYGPLNLSNTKSVSEDVYAEYSRRYAPSRGDIIITRVGANFGVTSYVEKTNFCLGQNTAAIIPKINPNYLYYILNSAKCLHQMNVLVAGAAQPTLSLKAIKALDIPRLGDEIEERIANIIGDFNEKIELNRQSNQTLEQMAQALFKSWFVDFDPVIDNALAAGNTIPDSLQARAEVRKKAIEERASNRKLKPLPEDIQQLFPSEFEDSELGWIPKGWSNEPLYDLGEFINGAAYKKFEPNKNNEGLPIIKIAELKSGITANTGFSTVDMPKKYHLKDQDILFSWSGNPDTSIDTFVWALGNALLNQHIFKVIPNGLSNYSFLLALLKYLKPEFTAIARDKQTTGLGHVTVKNLKELFVVIPSDGILMKFEEHLAPIFNRMFLTIKNTQLLGQQRDFLLPKLISGQIELPE